MNKELYNLFNKTKTAVIREYSELQENIIDISRINKVELKIDNNMVHLAANKGTYICLKTNNLVRFQTELLFLHEWMHQAFLNTEFIQKQIQTLDETYSKKPSCLFINQLLDSFIDLQIKKIWKFKQEIWFDLDKPYDPPYGLIKLHLGFEFNQFIKKYEINKKKVNLIVLVEQFLQKNKIKILKYGFDNLK